MAIWHHGWKSGLAVLMVLPLLLVGIGCGTARATDASPARATVGDGKHIPKVEVNTRILNYGNHVYFVEEETGGRSRRVWRTDGKESGTAVFYDFGDQTGEVRLIGVYQDLIYLNVLSPGHIHELWVSDGTVDGTVQLLTSEAGDFDVWYEFDSWVYFSEAEEFDHEDFYNLYRTDGTPEMVEQVVAPGITDRTDEIEVFPHRAVHTESRVYFWSTPFGGDLWMHHEHNFHLVHSFPKAEFYRSQFAVNNDTVYFLAQTADGAEGIWRSDDSEEGAQLVHSLPLAYYDSSLLGFIGEDFLQLNSHALLFESTENGLNMHRFNLKTEELSHIMLFENSEGEVVKPGSFALDDQGADSRLVFSIDFGNGSQFWHTLGTPNSTHALGQKFSTKPYELSIQANGIAFLAGDVKLYWMEFDGARPFTTHNLGSYLFMSPSLTTAQGYVYYTAYDTVGINQLWRLNPENLTIRSFHFPTIAVFP